MRKNKVFLAIFLFLALLTTSCAPRAGKWDYPKKIAILPIFNESLDVEADKVIYPMIYRSFVERGFYITPPVVMYEMLREDKNVREAGMINSMTIKEQGEYLHADALLNVTITDWSTKFIGIISVVTVEIHVRLIDAKTGKLIFETTEHVSKGNEKVGFNLESVIDAVAHAATQKYEPLAEEAAAAAGRKLPRGKFRTKKVVPDLPAATDVKETKKEVKK